MMMTIDDAIKTIKKGKLEPVYLLFGTEQYFIEKFRDAIEKQFSSDDAGEITTYDLREVSIQDVLADAETLPFFTEKKIIFADYPFFLTNVQEKVPIEHDVTVLERYIENPAPFSHVIFVAPYESLDGRKKLTKNLRKHSVEVNCQPIKGTNLNDWFNLITAPLKVDITEEAKDILEAEFGANLSLLQREIEKLTQYVGEGGTITAEVLHELMSSSVEHSALSLVDAVLNKKLPEAINISKHLFKMGESPIGLIALLAYQFRIIYQVKLLRAKGFVINQIQQEIKAHPYVIKLAFERGKKYSEDYLETIINELANADTNIKRGKMNQQIAFEMLLYQITR